MRVRISIEVSAADLRRHGDWPVYGATSHREFIRLLNRIEAAVPAGKLDRVILDRP
jgi:hypothetical protein